MSLRTTLLYLGTCLALSLLSCTEVPSDDGTLERYEKPLAGSLATDSAAVKRLLDDNSHPDVNVWDVTVHRPVQDQERIVEVDLSGMVNPPIRTVAGEALSELTAVEVLNLSSNRIERLPNDLGNMTSLAVLNVRRNLLSELPLTITQLRNMHILDARENALRFVPGEIGELTGALERLQLAHNQLISLPDEVMQMGLTEFIVDDNRLCGALSGPILAWLDNGGAGWRDIQACGPDSVRHYRLAPSDFADWSVDTNAGFPEFASYTAEQLASDSPLTGIGAVLQAADVVGASVQFLRHVSGGLLRIAVMDCRASYRAQEVFHFFAPDSGFQQLGDTHIDTARVVINPGDGGVVYGHVNKFYISLTFTNWSAPSETPSQGDGFLMALVLRARNQQ